MADLPKNPEIETVEGVRFPDLDEGSQGGTVYVTRDVPDLKVEVLPGQHVKIPEGDDPGEAGDYFEGDTFVTHGPTAHMLEARGYVKILEAVS